MAFPLADVPPGATGHAGIHTTDRQHLNSLVIVANFPAANLDAQRSPGRFWCLSASAPAGVGNAILEVTTVPGGSTMQKLIGFDTGITAYRIGNPTTWAAWHLTPLIEDTGRRNVATSLINGWTTSNVIVRRVGHMVTWMIRGLSPTAATATAVTSAITGFAPGLGGGPTRFPYVKADGALGYLSVASDGSLVAPLGTATPTDSWVQFSIEVSSAFPAALPGTAA